MLLVTGYKHRVVMMVFLIGVGPRNFAPLDEQSEMVIVVEKNCGIDVWRVDETQVWKEFCGSQIRHVKLLLALELISVEVFLEL